MASKGGAVDRLQQQIDEYVQHLREIERVFNEHADQVGLDVRLDATRLIQAVEDGIMLDRVASFFDRGDDDAGVLHPAQVRTAIDCIRQLLDRPGDNGLVLGAMQSGKTTTSLALQFAGPAIYLLTGRRIYPIYLTTSHTSQADQTEIELRNFLDYYGTLRIVTGDKVAADGLDVGFLRAPTIAYYRGHVLRAAFQDTYAGPQLEDFVQRRVQGQRVGQIADLCQRANSQGFEPILMIDEPQFGEGDRMVTNPQGAVERQRCVLLQIFQAIEEAIGVPQRHSFIGLSATPYSMHELEGVWVARQYLTSAYRGFNCFGNHTISEGVEIEPPQTCGFSSLATTFKLPELRLISMAAYKATPRRFPNLARKLHYSGTQDSYRQLVHGALRTAILRMIAESGGDQPVGVCIRPLNNNVQAYEFVRRLNLESAGIEVLHYSGSEYSGMSVKRAIRGREHPDRPFVIVVTNRARMGDAFPRQVRWFIDLSKQATDLNALLQGLLGRACGYDKISTVVLSDENERLVADYVRTEGGYVYRTSRNSVVVGGYRRGAPTSTVRLRADANDPVVCRFFQRITREVIDNHVIQDRATLQTTRSRNGERRVGPILTIAEEEGLFDHIEAPEIARRLFPNMTDIRIVRAGEEVPHGRDSSRMLGYAIDGDGHCQFTLRWSQGTGSHSGRASRGYGARDAADRSRASDKLEPQIHMEKFDLRTDKVIYDKDESIKVVGRWRPSMITLPLLRPVRELREGLASLPGELSVYTANMSEEERELAAEAG